MTRVVVDTSLPDKLPRLIQPVEFFDAAGRRIGWFTPNLSRYENLEPEISEEELQRRAAGRDGRTLSEIMADLEKLG